MMVFREARPEDDPQLTSLIAKPMPGALSLSFCREPSFLRSCAECGPPRRVLVAEAEGRMVALCSHFLHTYRVGGVEREIWTVGDFRALPEAAYRSVTGRGWRALRERLQGKPAVMSVVDQNMAALRLFAKQRKGWPRLHPVARLQTYLFPLMGVAAGDEYGLVRPSADVFSNSWNDREGTPFQPRLQRSLIAGDLFALSDGAGLRAAGCLWDQSAHRQWRVAGYSGAYRRLYQMGVLPAPGHPVSVATACFLHGQAAARAELLARLRALAAARGYSFLVYSQSCDRPLPFPRWWPRLSYPSTLYQLVWEGDEELLFGNTDYPVCWL